MRFNPSQEITAVPTCGMVVLTEGWYEFQPLSGNHGRSDVFRNAKDLCGETCFNPSQEITAVPTFTKERCMREKIWFQPLSGNHGRSDNLPDSFYG